jgi:hypothetical protein
MAQPTGTSPASTTPAAAPARRRSAPTSRGRGVAVRAGQAVLVLGLLTVVATRALAAPTGPIAVSGDGAAGSGAAQVSYGIDAQGRVDRVTVARPASAPDEDVTVEVHDASGASLGRATARLQGPASVVALATPVDPAAVAAVALSR